MTESPPKDLRYLVHKYPMDPARPIDPAAASNLQLAEHGLPERPDPQREPDLHAFVEEMLATGTTLVEPRFPWDEQRIIALEAATSVPTSPSVPLQTFAHAETSRNWSGAYMTPNPRPNRFMLVTGAWKVPMPATPMVPPAGVDPINVEYQSSTWIGLGGHRSYNSLPQIGTSQHLSVKNGVASVRTEAWWQWWIKDRPPHDIPVPIKNFEVLPGDEILSSVTVEAPSPGEVRFNLKNQRTRKIVAFKVRAPANIPPLGSTVEWVHERPTRRSIMFPLPHCTDVQFRHCLAWNVPQFGAPMVLQKLDGSARLLRMTAMFDRPHRPVHISNPEVEADGRLTIRYREAGAMSP